MPHYDPSTGYDRYPSGQTRRNDSSSTPNHPYSWDSYNPTSYIDPMTSRGSQITGGKAYQEYELDKDLMERQQNFDYDMWVMQNEYDSPTAQMERYIAAGMTPAAAASAVLQNSGAGQPITQGSAPSVSGESFGSELGSTVGSVTSAANGFKAFQEGLGTLIDNNTRGQKNALQLREIEAHTHQMTTAAGLNGWQSRKLQADIWRIEKLTPVEVQKGVAQIQEILKSLEEMDAHIAEMNSQTELNNEEKELVTQNANKAKYDALIEKWRYNCITLWGFDPNSTLYMAGVQSIMSGQGTSFFKALGENVASMVTSIPDIVKSIIGGNGEDGKGTGLQGLFQGLGEQIVGGVNQNVDQTKAFLLMLYSMFMNGLK